MMWTFYPDELDALQKLDCPAMKATEQDVIMNEYLRHCGLCDHVYGVNYRLTEAGHAVLKALFDTTVDWWNAGSVAVSFDGSMQNPVVTASR